MLTMTSLAALPAPALALPPIIAVANGRTRLHFVEFFIATIRNAHTRRACARGIGDFLTWCSTRSVVALHQIQPLQVTAWIEGLSRDGSVPTVKQRLAAIRHLFDWLGRSQVILINPTRSVRAPSKASGAAKRRHLIPQRLAH